MKFNVKFHRSRFCGEEIDYFTFNVLGVCISPNDYRQQKVSYACVWELFIKKKTLKLIAEKTGSCEYRKDEGWGCNKSHVTSIVVIMEITTNLSLKTSIAAQYWSLFWFRWEKKQL